MKNYQSKRFIFLFILLLAFSGIGEAKNTLWKVESENNTVYLLGSVHVLKAGNYPLDKVIEDAFKDSQRLVLEMDLVEMNDPDTQALMLTGGVLKDGKTLKTVLSEGEYQSLKKSFDAAGLPLQHFESIKPWFTALSIMSSKLIQMGYDPNFGVDKYFYDKAQKEGKEIIGLETFEYQVGLFDKIGLKGQVSFLKHTLNELDKMEKQMDSLISAWQGGDDNRLENLLLEDYEQYPLIFNKLLVERNNNWLPKIEDFIGKEDNYFVVVGAGHLVGNKGIIELLKTQGYDVTQN